LLHEDSIILLVHCDFSNLICGDIFLLIWLIDFILIILKIPFKGNLFVLSILKEYFYIAIIKITLS